MFALNNKRTLITGGASGLGLAIAKRFATAGASVIISDINNGETQAKSIQGHFIECDVSNSESVQSLFTQVKAQFGGLDVLINNAGISGVDGVSIEDSDNELTHNLFDINTMGVLHGLKYGPKIISRGGSIINTSSLASTLMFPGSGPYSASKAAVSNLTKMSALELADKQIRVNAVAPSFIRTPMAEQDMDLFESIGRKATCVGRIAEPDEIASVYHFLASDDASYINGQVIDVDGGMSLGFTSQQLAWMITNSDGE